jgi:hypothetical protein
VHERQEAYKKAQMEAPPREAPGPGAESITDDTQAPVLRHREAATVSTPGVVAPDAGATVAHQRPEILTLNVEAKGNITDLNCSGSATLELTLKSPGGTKQLYTDNYFRIPYSALNYTPQGDLNPCLDIKGMRAQITYHPAKDHPEQGEIVAVQLMK